MGTAISDIFADAEDNDHRISYFEYDASNLVEGIYSFCVDVFVMNEYGGFMSVDHPVDSVAFEIVKDGTKTIMEPWRRKDWGSVILNTMKVIEPITET